MLHLRGTTSDDLRRLGSCQERLLVHRQPVVFVVLAMSSEQSDYLIDVAQIKEDIALALGATGVITQATPCWKCGAIQPCHYCRPEWEAEERLRRFAGAERVGNEPLRKWTSS